MARGRGRYGDMRRHPATSRDIPRHLATSRDTFTTSRFSRHFRDIFATTLRHLATSSEDRGPPCVYAYSGSADTLSKCSRWWRGSWWDAVSCAEAAEIFNLHALRRRRGLRRHAVGAGCGGRTCQSSSPRACRSRATQSSQKATCSRQAGACYDWQANGQRRSRVHPRGKCFARGMQ